MHLTVKYSLRVGCFRGALFWVMAHFTSSSPI